MYRGTADHDITAELKKKIKIPVFASGNIFTALDAKKILEYTGCDGVFVARGALGKPWIFKATKDILSGKDKFDAPGFDEIKRIMIEHFSLSVRFQGEFLARKRMYKHVTILLSAMQTRMDALQRLRIITD